MVDFSIESCKADRTTFSRSLRYGRWRLRELGIFAKESAYRISHDLMSDKSAFADL